MSSLTHGLLMVPPVSLSPPMSPPMSPSTITSLADGIRYTESRGITKSGKIMILCFDGTRNTLGAEISNVVRFFRALLKDYRKRQLVYYQPGIATYKESVIDAAIAWSIEDHIKEGYQFIVQNYRPGDRICVFGFSRGAHIARVVAAMIYKVGVIPSENISQVNFAFNVYGITGYNGYKQSQEFKNTFTPALAHDVSVDFVGVWDCVSSVGIISKPHPYTSVNYAVKKFRHALSLDEHRARFRPDMWNEIMLAREHELDIDIPVRMTDVSNRDRFVYEPPERDSADVKEVWFAGAHADVGGGSGSDLSFISLRWMIKECILSETGILFDLKYLRDDLHFDFHGLVEEIDKEDGKGSRIKQYKELKIYGDAQKKQRGSGDGGSKETINNPTATRTDKMRREHKQKPDCHTRHALDARDQIFDQLFLFWFLWWMLEIIPLLYTYQDCDGNWVRRRMCNFGRGRYIPAYKNRVLVHSSVKRRINDVEKKDKYKPRAINWEHLQEQKLIEYVD